ERAWPDWRADYERQRFTVTRLTSSRATHPIALMCTFTPQPPCCIGFPVENGCAPAPTYFSQSAPYFNSGRAKGSFIRNHGPWPNSRDSGDSGSLRPLCSRLAHLKALIECSRKQGRL